MSKPRWKQLRLNHHQEQPLTTRRHFIQQSLTAAGSAALGASLTDSGRGALHFASDGTRAPAAAAQPRRILILGGTGFTGPYQVQYAVSRGHRVTVFNRGRRDTELPASVEQLTGDRNGDLESLKGREWDVVIDIPATLPRWVRESAQLLKDSARHYVFVSTISVYASTAEPGTDESAPLATMPDPDSEDPRYYGAQKALAEGEAERAFPGRATIVRPGLIVGPGDNSGRFTYWPDRICKGGEVLAPGNPGDPVQIIDARDLAEFVVRLAEGPTPGIFNATGPRARLSMAEMLYGIRAVCSGSTDVRFTWVDAAFLGAQQVRPWSDMPVWVPPTPQNAGFSQVSIAKALAHGLTFRPLSETARDTLSWYRALPESARERRPGTPGLSAEREREVLRAWHAR